MQTTNQTTGETINYNRVGGTSSSPIYYNDPIAQGVQQQVNPTNQPVSITATSLTSETPIKVPNVNTDTGASGLITDVGTRTQSQIDQANKEYQQLQGAVGNKSGQAQTAFDEAVSKIYGKKTDVLNQAAQDNPQLIEQRKALNDINTQIANEQVALRAEQDRIRKESSSIGQANVELGNLNDTYGRRLADLAIRQSAAQGNIEGIQKDSDRKTALLLAPIESALDYYKTFGKDNIENLSKKEQAQLTFLQSNLEKQKADIKDLESAKASALMTIAQEGGGKNLALTAKITSAKSIGEIAQLASSSGYIGLTDRLYKQAQTEKLNAEAAKDRAASLNSQGTLSDEQYKRVLSLQDDFDTQTKSQRTVIDNTKNIISLADQAKTTNPNGANPAAQIGIVYAYMKSLDPTSTVREGEYATAQNSAGIDSKIRNAYNKTLDGNFLADSQIDNFVNSSLSLAKEANKQLVTRASEFDRRAKLGGIPQGLIYQDQAQTIDSLKATPPKSNAFSEALNSNSNMSIYNPETGYIIPNTK